MSLAYNAARTVIRLTVGINLGGFIGNAIWGNPDAAIVHFALGTVGVIFLVYSKD